jgi:hypothetical protein
MELFATLKNECEDIKNNCIAVENRLKASLEEFSKQTKAAEVSHTAMLASNEAAFRNHVMMEGPAQYWERIEERYRRAAGFHTAKAVAVVSIGLIFITVLLAAPLEGLKGTSFSATSVRSIVLLTFGSALIFLLAQLCIKLSLGAHHLANDAKERHQLTLVYLALLKNGAITEGQSQIVFASLFSRSDTGLLKNDGTPAVIGMSGIFADLLKSKSGT